MKNDLNIKLSATLDKKTIESIIKEALEKETGKKVSSITFSISKVGDDRMSNGWDELTGCTVNFETGPYCPEMPVGSIPRGTTRC